MHRLEKALDVLTAMGLLELYRADELTGLAPSPLTVRSFLAKPLYKNLLARKIGSQAWRICLFTYPIRNRISQNIFSGLYHGWAGSSCFEPKHDFDWSVLALMAKDKLLFRMKLRILLRLVT